MHQQQEEDYKFLQEVLDAAIAHAKPGVTAGELHTFIVDMVKEKRPELEQHLTKVCRPARCDKSRARQSQRPLPAHYCGRSLADLPTSHSA